MEYVNEQELIIQNTIINNLKACVRCNVLPETFRENVYYTGVNPQSIGGWNNCYFAIRVVGRKIEIIGYTKAITKDEVDSRLYELLNVFNKSTFWGKYFYNYDEGRIVYKTDLIADDRDYNVAMIFDVINNMLSEMVEHVVGLIDQYVESLYAQEKPSMSAQNTGCERTDNSEDTEELRARFDAISEEIKEAEEELEDFKLLFGAGFAPESKVRELQLEVDSLREKQTQLATKLGKRGEGFVIKKGGSVIIGLPKDGFEGEDDYEDTDDSYY